mmetsp:Transcript_390/g.1223  ORF Transcript_390/g.1223 Transcript_390/m.1223 type:complete len:295 (+) Transcript_390:53-937(+)
MHPSNSGLFVTCANLPQTTRPVVVTSPSSETFTSMTVPLVMTPNDVYIADDGFFLTPKISKQNVALSSGCVTCAFFIRRPDGRMKRSYFGGFRVNVGSTNVIFVTTRFHAFFFRFPDAWTRNISSSATARTFGMGTDHLPAFSARFCLMELDKILARDAPSRSSKNAGTAPSSGRALAARASFSSCALIVLRIVAFSLKRCLLKSFARRPWTFCANAARSWTWRASFFRRFSGASRRSPWRFRCCSMYSCCGMVQFVRLLCMLVRSRERFSWTDTVQHSRAVASAAAALRRGRA